MRWLLIAMAALATPAFADYYDGNELYGLLQANSQFRLTKRATTQQAYESGIAQGYVGGVQDSANGQPVNGFLFFCVPSEVKGSQAEEITLNYLKAHPEERHLPAKTLVIWALAEKFPCGKGAIAK